MIIKVVDLNHEGLKCYARLTEAQLRNRIEPEKGIAESPKVIKVALQAGCIPLSLLMEERQLEGQGGEIVSLCGDVPVYVGDRDLLAQLTGYELTRGVLCAMQRPHLPTPEEICRQGRRIAIIDSVVNSTNTGAIFRAAASLGMDGVLLTPSCCDPLNRRSVRVSMGTVFQVKWTYIQGWPHPAMEQLKAWGYSTAALALRPGAMSVDNPQLKAQVRLAIVMGTEGDGLSGRVIDDCDYRVIIPMQNGVDSLNVAAAAAVAFWELSKR